MGRSFFFPKLSLLIIHLLLFFSSKKVNLSVEESCWQSWPTFNILYLCRLKIMATFLKSDDSISSKKNKERYSSLPKKRPRHLPLHSVIFVILHFLDSANTTSTHLLANKWLEIVKIHFYGGFGAVKPPKLWLLSLSTSLFLS